VSPAASTAREAGAPFGDRAAHCILPAGAEPRGDDGGGRETPAARPSWLARTRANFRNSVWANVALKLIGLALAMLALSGVGVASVLSGANGVPVPLAGMLGADLHSSWLAKESTGGPRAGSGGASPRTALTASAASPSLAASQLAASHSAPTIPVAADAPPATREGVRSQASMGITDDGKVILNLAGLEDLRHLPGVGPKRADAILLLRARLGRFKQVSDLLRVKGIGVRGLKKIMPHVVLDAPAPST
jgi:competence protein ComEA